MVEKKYAKIIDEKTREVQIGVGCTDEYYIEIGMELMDVEQSYTGRWYVAGYAPQKPEPTIDERKRYMRSIRDEYINNIEWRVSRYRDQKEMGIPTSDTEEMYMKILQYMQYLRDYPESSLDWYNAKPMTFEKWLESQN